MVIDGKKIAGEILAELKNPSASRRTEKFLAAVLVGEDPASVSFLKQKERVAHELSVDFRFYRFPTDITQDTLRDEVIKIASHKTCGGVLVQLPLPAHIGAQYVLNAIPREKDVDVLGERALGAFYTGRNLVLPPAVGVVEKVLKANSSKLEASKSVIIGRGFLIGRPVAMWLMGKVAELTVFNSTTKDLRGKLKDADLVISGVGKADIFSADDVKENALVIDFGYSKVMGNEQGVMSRKIVGDFTPPLPITRYPLLIFTPTPGGTGPILVAQLFENFYILNATK